MLILEKEKIYNEHLNEKKSDLMRMEFETGNILVADRYKGLIIVCDKSEAVQIAIQIQDGGLEISLNASKLNITSSDELVLSSKKIEIKASEELSIKTSGNFIQQIGKDILTEVQGTNKMIAETHKITADLGNVEIVANDDVCLNGERVKFNCD